MWVEKVGATEMTTTRRASVTLLSLGVPLAIGFVSQMAIAFTDAVLVARLGSRQLAGTTLALSLFSVMMLLGIGLVTAASPKLAESFRTSDQDELRTWYMQGNWLAIGTGILGLLLLLNTERILLLLGESESLAAIAQQYNIGAAWGMPLFLLYVNARGAMSAVGKPQPLTWIMLAAIPVNAALGYLAIFGIGTLPGAGVTGAGWSSTAVRLLVVIAFGIVFHRNQHFRSLQFRLTSPDPKHLLTLAGIGAPIGARIGLGEGFLPVLAFFVAKFGSDSVAAHAVGLRVASLLSVVALGFSSAATTMSAWARAERDANTLRSLRNALLIVGGGYSVGLSIAIALTFPFIANMVFALNASAEAALYSLAPFLVLYFITDTVGSAFNGYLVGQLDTALPTIVVVVSFWIVGLGIGLTVSEHTALGFAGLWLGMAIAATIVAAFNVARASTHMVGLTMQTNPKHG